MVATEKEKKTNDQGRIEPKLTHNEIKISILLANRIRRDDWYDVSYNLIIIVYMVHGHDMVIESQTLLDFFTVKEN